MRLTSPIRNGWFSWKMPGRKCVYFRRLPFAFHSLRHFHFELCCPHTLPAWSCARRQLPQTPHGTPFVTYKSHVFAGAALSRLSPSSKPRLWGLTSLGSQPVIGAIAECCHCCCKEQQQLSLLESPESLRRCDHARPGQNLDLSDPARRLSDPKE